LPSGDLVSTLAGLARDGTIAALRAARADATRFTQGSHDALFEIDIACEPRDATTIERSHEPLVSELQALVRDEGLSFERARVAASVVEEATAGRR
jgi:hypothetical protein